MSKRIYIMSIPKSETEIGKDLDIELRRLLTKLIRRCPKSRDVIAEQMSVLSGLPISKHMIDDWTAERREASKRARFPAFLIAAFCEVTGSDELQRWAAGPRLRTLLEFSESALKAMEARRQRGS